MNCITQAMAAVLLCAATAATAQSAGGGPADAAQVLRSVGATTLVRGASLSTPVRAEVPIRSGDLIRTGADGQVQLRFADGALISIHPDSDFRVTDFVFEGGRERSVFELMKGRLRAVSGRIGKRDHDDWRLKTPTATIGIRGTEFTVAEHVCPPAGCAAGADAGLEVAVIAGRVAVANEAGSVVVPAGATLKLRDARTVPVLATAPARPRPAAAGPSRPSGGTPGHGVGDRDPLPWSGPPDPAQR